MLSIIKRELNIGIIASIIYIILGAIIVSNPEATLKIVSTAISVFAIVYGVIVTIINITDIKEEHNLLFGILLIVIGVALLIYPNSLNILISLGIGIWFIASSINRIKLYVMIKDIDEVNWIVILISSVITLLIGISFIFAPLASAVTLTTVSGILLITYSVIDIVEIIIIKMHMKAIEKALM